MFITDTKVEVRGAIVRITGFEDLQVAADGPERRVVSRLVMTNETFRSLLSEGRRKLAREGH